jgi:hypothetical protein
MPALGNENCSAVILTEMDKVLLGPASDLTGRCPYCVVYQRRAEKAEAMVERAEAALDALEARRVSPDDKVGGYILQAGVRETCKRIRAALGGGGMNAEVDA